MQNDRCDQQHSKWVGSIVQDAVHGICEMPSHAAPRPGVATQRRPFAQYRENFSRQVSCADRGRRLSTSVRVSGSVWPRPANERNVSSSVSNKTRREGLFLGYSRRIDHATTGMSFRLLDARHLVLLRKQLKYCLLHLHAAIEIGIWNCKARKLPQRRIEFALVIFGIGCRVIDAGIVSSRGAEEPVISLRSRCRRCDACLGFPYAHIAVAIDLAQRLQTRTAQPGVLPQLARPHPPARESVL